MLLHVLLLPTLLLAAPALSFPQEDGADNVSTAIQEDGAYITLKLDESRENGLSLSEFIKICQLNTGLNFTIDESQSANLSSQLDQKKLLLYGRKRIKKEDFYSFFQIMMKIHGFVCVQQGEGDLAVIVITADTAANSAMIKANTIFVDYQDVPQYSARPGTRIATVIPLKNADANDIASNLRSALAPPGSGSDSFMPLTQERAILVQGYGPAVAAGYRMIMVLDREPDTVEPVFRKIPLRESSAEELAEMLGDLMENMTSQTEARGSRSGRNATPAQTEIETHITPYPRENALIVTASPDNMEKVLDLVATLDVQIDKPETNFRVYQLQNINAKDLDEDLAKFLDKTQQAEEAVMRNSSAPGAQARRANQKVIVVSQEETNSLLITATRTKWGELERLLTVLDKRQPQVLIETALIEVSEDFSNEIGFEFANVQAPLTDTSQRGFGFTSMGLTGIGADYQFGDPRLPDPTAAGITAGILDGTDLGIPFLLRAARTSNNANILSIPSVLVANNHGASVKSTDQVPRTTISTTGTGLVNSGNDGYEDAGIELIITPSISSGKFLRLAITLTVSSFRGEGINGGLPPKIERTLDTTVFLPDGATMWVGGIVRDDLIQSESGIPYLSDIPVLGFLFGKQSDSNVKTTLFFFCTPRIMDDWDEMADITEGGKSRAAEVIGLDRLRQVDPDFQFDSPVDVILQEEEGPAVEGVLDLDSFGAPTFVREVGVIEADRVGADREQAQQ